LVLRLMALVTSRYNWQRDELAVGQREIARLWCVDERTVKRDMARLRGLGWIVVKRQGARGRVSVLGLDLDRLMIDTKPEWQNIGPDFVARMGGEARAPEAGPQVIPFPRATPVPVPADGLWGRACALLEAEDRLSYEAWFAGLREGGVEGDCLLLIAPSRFHAAYVQSHLLARLRIAVLRSDGRVGRVRIETG
jgi:DNA-binding transcriptional MocR family regulator